MVLSLNSIKAYFIKFFIAPNTGASGVLWLLAIDFCDFSIGFIQASNDSVALSVSKKGEPCGEGLP